jgi:protein involved in polysaccharide export with SLBB domain
MEGEFSDNPPPPILPEAPVAAPRQKSSTPSSPIRPGDTLELLVEEDSTFDGTYRVREQGDIHLRSVGKIRVSGLGVAQAESLVRSKLEATQLRKATVTLDRVGRAPEEAPEISGAPQAGVIRIFMTGHVNRPGQHRLPLPDAGTLGVYEAILIAGGFSSFPDLPKVHLLRRDAQGKRHKIPVNIQQIQTGQIADPPIGDGDVVVVPEKIFGF